MFLCSLFKELCIKEENGKTGCNFNFGHECISRPSNFVYVNENVFMLWVRANNIWNKKEKWKI